MRPAYIQRFVRFSVALLLLLLATLLLQPDLTGLRTVTLNTAVLLGRYVLYAAPMAVLFGVPAGLRPGSLRDRLMQLPVVLLAGMPAVLIGLALLQAVGAGETRPAWLTELGATLVAAPWLARALRMGMAGTHGKGARPAMLACLGRVLQQYGNLAVCVLTLDATLGAGPAAMFGGTSIGSVMLGLALPALVSHLLGDLLVTFAEGTEPVEPAPRPFFRLMAVGVILTLGLALAGLRLIGISLVGTVVATAGGLLIGLVSTEHFVGSDQEAPSLLAPFVVGTCMAVWLKLAWWAVSLGVGLAMAPWLAAAVSRAAAAPAALQTRRSRALAGGVITLLARALYLQVLLEWASLAPALPLTRVLAAALGVAGLHLVGAGLAGENLKLE